MGTKLGSKVEKDGPLYCSNFTIIAYGNSGGGFWSGIISTISPFAPFVRPHGVYMFWVSITFYPIAISIYVSTFTSHSVLIGYFVP